MTNSAGTLTSSSLHALLPTLPFDLIPEILCRLPVKFLLQLKCVCKSWKDLISDHKFAKKHLRMSTTCRNHQHLIVASWSTKREWLLWDSPISSIFSTTSSAVVPQLQLMYPGTPLRYSSIVYERNPSHVISSCDGILLFDIDSGPPLLWNPSIRKLKILPPLLIPSRGGVFYTFGYDHFIDNYKIFAVSTDEVTQWKNEVSVYTLGYDSWRRIDDIPYDGFILEVGIFLSGTVNWLAFDASSSFLRVLVSLDLEKESYRKPLLTPDLNTLGRSTLGVLMGCLCIFTNNVESLDVWVMKEYGIKESWTKLFKVPYDVGGRGPSSFYDTKLVYVFEDDLVLLDYKELLGFKLVVYNSKKGTFKIPKIQNIRGSIVPKVYVDSLISPCF